MIQFRLIPLRASAVAVAAVCATAAVAQPTGGERIAPHAPVAVVVKVAKPWYAPRALVVSRMRKTVAQYEAIPGLSYKAYTLARPAGEFGGIYLWKDAERAQSWFSAAWFNRVLEERGTPANVRMFEIVAVLDNTPGGTPASSDSAAVATLVKMPWPTGSSREMVVQQLQLSLKSVGGAPGLLRSYLFLTEQEGWGGIHLWENETSAQAGLDQFRISGDKPIYGPEASVEWFDTPILTPSIATQP